MFSLNSCKKEENNTGRIIVWQAKANAEDNTANGITSFKLFVGGKLSGSMAADLFWNVAPDCGNTSAMNATWDLGTKTSQTVTYEIKDQDDNVVYNGTITVEKDVCKQLELTL